MKKLKISISERRKIRQIKAKINAHREREEREIQQLAESMGLTEQEAEILWDYVYNDSSWTVEIEKR